MPLMLSDLPLELFDDIIILSSAQGAARLSQCSKQFNSVIAEREHIWRSLYLEHWDDPRESDSVYNYELNWKEEVEKGTFAYIVLRAIKAVPAPFDVNDSLLADQERAYEYCASILIRSSGRDGEFPGDISGSRNLQWLRNLVGEHAVYLWPWLIQAPIFEEHLPVYARERSPRRYTAAGDSSDEDDGYLPLPPILKSPYLAKQSARWELMQRAGYPRPPLPDFAVRDDHLISDVAQTRFFARCFVYDMRKYNTDTLWGPWMPRDAELVQHNANGDHGGAVITENRVNWQAVFNLMIVVIVNREEYMRRGGYRQLKDSPIGYLSTRPYSAIGWKNRKPGDWAGVEGVWTRVIGFMDYRDLVRYNFPNAELPGPNDPLDTSIIYGPHFGEEFRVLSAEITIDTIDDPSTPGLVDPSRPTIRFKGVSRGGVPDDSTVRGHVSITTSGEIRWHIEVAIFNQEERWQSSGVQIGGPGSAFGIVGCWSPFEHDSIRDPAGPFWMWKE